jgi:hypothetical protein
MERRDKFVFSDMNRGLLFIPDISGFTRFVHETELDHSRLIIKELLEVIIDSNDSGLEISEIEGDAILFYKFGEPPALGDLYHQVEKMFRAFHQSLIAYDVRRYCQCKACTSAISLSLKVITHYGEFTQYSVSTFRKLIGKDLIVAHQLLKNEIPEHEYWLITSSLSGTSAPGPLTPWMKWDTSMANTESGMLPFHFTQLGPLKKTVEPEPVPELNLAQKEKIISVQREYKTDLITLFHATGDFNYRHRWQDGVKHVEEIIHFLPRIGMKCRCSMENGEHYIYSSSYRYREDHIEFSETDDNTKCVTYFTLLRKSSDTTELRIDFYTPVKPVLDKLPGEDVNSIREKFLRSLNNLEPLIKTLRIPTALTE